MVHAPADDPPVAGATVPADRSTAVEEAFFRRGEEEDQAARQQLRERLAAMPRWRGLRWAIALLVASVLVAAVLLLAFPSR